MHHPVAWAEAGHETRASTEKRGFPSSMREVDLVQATNSWRDILMAPSMIRRVSFFVVSERSIGACTIWN